MAEASPYLPSTMARADIESQKGSLLLDFGVDWCPHCQQAEALLAEALAGKAGLRHLKVEDGPGRRLGRSYQVKLWPTLIFLFDGQEMERLVRPTEPGKIEAALRRLVP